MAKIVKKKSAAKATPKSAKKAPAKAVKAAPKKAAKTVVKKAAAKPAPKPVKKVEAKKAPAKKKVEAKSSVKPSAKVTKEAKVKAEAPKKEKKVTPAVAVAAALEKPAKKDVKPAGKKAKATVKAATKKEKEESDIDDDFIADSDMGDEIGEYEEELKAVEEADEDIEIVEEWPTEDKSKDDEEIILTDAEGRRYCRARDCDQAAVVDAYCRYHYLLYWKKIQVRKKILADGKLERYVEELTSRYPDKFLEMIRRDLRTEKDFLAAIQELEIDESVGENDFEEDTSAYIEEVRGMETSGSSVDDDDY